jgi:hypothetical protein
MAFMETRSLGRAEQGPIAIHLRALHAEGPYEQRDSGGEAGDTYNKSGIQSA